MKNILILLILLISSNIYAQPPVKKAEMKEKIKSLKISFITENLELTSEEAQQFWPVYNNYESRIIKLRHEDGRLIQENIRKNIQNISENDAQNYLFDLQNIESEILKLNTALNQALSKIISYKKILLLKKLELDFKRRMIKRLKSNRNKKRQKK
jgi:hypothetical protein